MNTAATITFDKMTTFQGVSECMMLVNGMVVGSLERERPIRFRASQRGLVRDNSRPWQYNADIDGTPVEIPDGASLREAKRIMREAYEARNS